MDFLKVVNKLVERKTLLEVDNLILEQENNDLHAEIDKLKAENKKEEKTEDK